MQFVGPRMPPATSTRGYDVRKYRVSKKNVGLFRKCYISFIHRGNFFKFSVVAANQYPFAPMMFQYQMALLTGSDVIML